MSSRATGTSSFTQKYCWRRRDPHALCSRLKEMARLASVAEKSLTGMETSPNEMVNEAIERAAMLSPERFFEVLLAHQGVAPAIARARQALRRVGDPEIERVRACELFPGQRHRHRRAGCASRRVGNVQRLATDVHIVVHKDFSRSFRHAPFQGDVLWMQAQQVAADRLAH